MLCPTRAMLDALRRLVMRRNRQGRDEGIKKLGRGRARPMQTMIGRNRVRAKLEGREGRAGRVKKKSRASLENGLGGWEAHESCG